MKCLEGFLCPVDLDCCMPYILSNIFLFFTLLGFHRGQKSPRCIKFLTGNCFLGSSVPQSRGKLEAQLESLCRENESLRKAHESDGDALRIKCKIIEDQTETIRKLKDVSLIFSFGKRLVAVLKNNNLYL